MTSIGRMVTFGLGFGKGLLGLCQETRARFLQPPVECTGEAGDRGARRVLGTELAPAEVLREVNLYGEMHRFIPAWLSTVTSPARMAELPVSHHPRRLGESKYGISRTGRVLVDLLAMYFFLRFGSRPGHFFGGLGLVLGTIGAAILAYLLVLKLGGQPVGGRPLLWLGFFCGIAGLQFLTTGVLAEILARIYFDGNHARSYHVVPQPPSDQGWHG